MKIAITAFVAFVAVLGGLFVTALVAITTIAVLLADRIFHRGHAPSAQAVRRPLSSAAGNDAIEITATEIPAEQ